jgi:hypothetical protein
MKKAFLCVLAISVITSTAVAGTVHLPAAAPVSGSSVRLAGGVTASANPIPGEGAPMPTCFPGKNCGDDSSLRVIAGEGAPMPTCFPGKNCGDQDQFRMVAARSTAGLLAQIG